MSYFSIGLKYLTSCGRILIKMNFPFLKNKKTIRKSGFVYKQELIIKQGREQLKALVKKGLGVPVVLL